MQGADMINWSFTQSPTYQAINPKQAEPTA